MQPDSQVTAKASPTQLHCGHIAMNYYSMFYEPMHDPFMSPSLIPLQVLISSGSGHTKPSKACIPFSIFFLVFLDANFGWVSAVDRVLIDCHNRSPRGCWSQPAEELLPRPPLGALRTPATCFSLAALTGPKFSAAGRSGR